MENRLKRENGGYLSITAGHFVLIIYGHHIRMSGRDRLMVRMIFQDSVKKQGWKRQGEREGGAIEWCSWEVE